ncbi:unnamed protein product [Ranitomeya imitator]|uniref:Uncharacterized protein n=1 Tax=Ranitomeya imitator TaxID=111125 RepID=A0ABN9LQT0_9NEOB|nr:unnamed protein product [Ranitomeya imitator]
MLLTLMSAAQTNQTPEASIRDSAQDLVTLKKALDSVTAKSTELSRTNRELRNRESMLEKETLHQKDLIHNLKIQLKSHIESQGVRKQSERIQAYFVCPVEGRAKYCSAQAPGLFDLSGACALQYFVLPSTGQTKYACAGAVAEDQKRTSWNEDGRRRSGPETPIRPDQQRDRPWDLEAELKRMKNMKESYEKNNNEQCKRIQEFMTEVDHMRKEINAAASQDAKEPNVQSQLEEEVTYRQKLEQRCKELESRVQKLQQVKSDTEISLRAANEGSEQLCLEPGHVFTLASQLWEAELARLCLELETKRAESLCEGTAQAGQLVKAEHRLLGWIVTSKNLIEKRLQRFVCTKLQESLVAMNYCGFMYD